MTDDILSLDIETRSTVDLRKAGAHRYFEDASTAVLLAAWAINDGPVRLWRWGDPCPYEITEHVHHGGAVAAWNASFERLGWNHILGPRHGWPVPALEQFEDTAAAAAAMALPRGLGDAAAALGLDTRKDDEGYRLMLQVSKPRKARKGEDPAGVYWFEDDERLERLGLYCMQDVEVERAIRDRLVPLSDYERRVYHMDQRLNDRGLPIDVPLVEALLRIVEESKERLDADMAVTTRYAVTATTQVAQLKAWMKDRTGLDLESLDKASMRELLRLPDLPADARRALEIRREAAKSSTAKLKAMLACVSADGRARGQVLYHGASTGRWSGRLIQVQNFPRGGEVIADPAAAVPVMRCGSAALVEAIYGPAMTAVSDMLRACIATGR